MLAFAGARPSLTGVWDAANYEQRRAGARRRRCYNRPADERHSLSHVVATVKHMFAHPDDSRPLALPGMVPQNRPPSAYDPEQMASLPESLLASATVATGLGALVIDDCLNVLCQVPDNTFDLVVTSPPYDGQAKYDNGERYERDWYEDTFLKISAEIFRTLKPHGSFVLNYRSRRHNGERGTLQYELVLWLREQGFKFCDDFVWGKPSPPPGRWNRYLKDGVEYCFQFAKTSDWQFFPEHCLTPARWDRRDVERRKKLAHNYDRVNEPSGQGRKRVQAGPDMVRPSTLIYMEPEFLPNPTHHPTRFPVELPSFFIKLLTEPGQLVFDPFGGTCTTAVAAEKLDRRWLVCELDERFTVVLPERLTKGK